MSRADLDSNPERSGLARYPSMVGVVLLYALAAVIPLAFPPPAVLDFVTVGKEIVLFKEMLVCYLSAGIILVAALALLTPIWKRLLAGGLPVLLLAALIASLLLSSVLSRSPGYSLRTSFTEIVLIFAVVLSPLFLTTERRIRVMLYTMIASASLVALISASSSIGNIEMFNVWIYAMDPREMIEEGVQVFGGPMRAASAATLGNAEYVGMYMGGAFVLTACWILDGWGTSHHKSWPAWLAGLGLLGLFGVTALVTGTRGVFIVIAAGAVTRWLASTRVRGWILAAWLGLVLLGSFLIGLVAGIVLFVMGCLVFLVVEIRAGRFMPLWKALELRTRALLILVPSAMIAGVLMLSIPGPWNPREMNLIGRVLTAAELTDSSARQRLLFFMLAGQMMEDSPLFGLGPGQFASQFYPVLTTIVDQDESGAMDLTRLTFGSWQAEFTHNDYFQIAAEQGFAGLGVFLAMVAAVLAGLARIIRRKVPGLSGLAHALLPAICAYMAMMITSFPLHRASRMTTYFLLIGSAIALFAIDRLQTGSPPEGQPAEAGTDAS